MASKGRSCSRPSSGIIFPDFKYVSQLQSKLLHENFNSKRRPAASSTRNPSGTTSFPMPSPGMTAILKIFIWIWTRSLFLVSYFLLNLSNAGFPQLPRPRQRALGIGLRVGLDCFFGGQEIDWAELCGFRLKPRVDLRVNRAMHYLLDRIAYRARTVAAHQHDRSVAQRLGKSVTQLIVDDQHIGRARRIANLEDGCAGAKKRAHVMNGAQDRSGHTEWNDRRRMAMNDRHHIRSCAVDRRVNEPLKVHAAAARVDRLAILVELENIAG